MPIERSYVCGEQDGLLLLHKPVGIPTHSPGEGRLGFVEYLKEKLGRDLWVCHRLDKDTSGAIVFGLNSEVTGKLGTLFESHEVKKEYLFVTDRTVPKDRTITFSSHITKRRGRLVSWLKHEDMNATTTITYLRSDGQFSLWKAEPKTGKPHQIRLHAKDLGLNILGDKDHSGTSFPRLMLHAARINFSWAGKTIDFSTPPGVLFEDLKKCGDIKFAQSEVERDGFIQASR